jgi:hypothetical protein
MDKSLVLLTNRDEPVKLDRQRFAAEMAHLLATPGYTTDKSSLTERGLKEFKMEDKKVEAVDQTEEEFELELLAEEITSAIKATTETFMLSSPMALTVKKPNGGYSKVAHVGSEDFQPARAYLGKRGKLIFVFTPVMVSEYAEMEMDEASAKANLVGFKDFLKESVGSIEAKVAQIKVNLAAKQETAKMADRAETYKNIGFGSW